MVISAKRALGIIGLILLIVLGVFGVKYTVSYFYQLNYPRGYEEFVTRYAAEYEVDPDIVWAVIKTESDFEPDATSNVGARGLMQMMRDTFQWVSGKMKDTETTFDDMYDPEANIRYGTFLISYLYREFGRYDTAIAAYHAGRTATAKWLKNSAYSSDGSRLETIPSGDTRHYVDKVMKCYDKYQKIYEN